MTANVVTIFKCQVHTNNHSLTIMSCLTIVLLIRLVSFLFSIFKDEYSIDHWVWYRLTQDICNFLLCIMQLILLVQWHQTYQVMANPRSALNILRRNWAKVAEIALIVVYTAFMIFDIVVVIIDDQTNVEDRSGFVIGSYKFLEIIQIQINFCQLSASELVAWKIAVICFETAVRMKVLL